MDNDKNKISLSAQINKVIGNRVLFCSIAFIIIIFGLTIYDVSISINQLHSRIDEQIKPLEDFVINQAIIDNLDTVDLKIESFNERNNSFKLQWIRHSKPVNNKLKWNFPFSWSYDYNLANIADYQFGYFKVYGSFLADKTLIYDLLIRLILLAVFIISILSILYPLAKRIPEQLFINPIHRFLDLISNNTDQIGNVKMSLPVELEVLEHKILALLKTATEHERNKATIELGHLSARLAHDIRSPLSAMEMGLCKLSKVVHPNEISILANGIQSVRDIANNVLERYRNPYTSAKINDQERNYDDGNIVRPVLLSNIVNFVVSQKRHEWNKDDIRLTLEVEQNAKICWITVAPNEIKRMLSNLINNSVDALNENCSAEIKLKISKFCNNIYLEIKDNGHGIPEHKINDVLHGVSLKHTGKGLGLCTARQYMERINGDLSINSKVGKGTQVILSFPCTDNISWFPKKILIQPSNIVIVVDDDFTMLTYWQQRITKAGHQTKLFSNYNSAIKWVNTNHNLIDSAVFLTDYELQDKSVTGLMLLESIKQNDNKYLITSHAEDAKLQQAAKNSNVWLIPKAVVNEIEFSS